MTPVEVLRKAAAGMRARAEAATPGPWHVFTNRHPTSDGYPWGTVDYWRHPAGGAGRTIGFRWEGQQERANATQVASWHPAVALAVADWLDSEAYKALMRTNAPHPFNYPCEDEEYRALAVAHAYLGTQP